MDMTKRLQVLMDDADHAALQAAAAARRLSVADWVREALAAAQRRASSGDVDRKLAAIRAAVRHTGPTAQIDRLTAEVERAYRGGVGPGTEGGYEQ